MAAASPEIQIQSEKPVDVETDVCLAPEVAKRLKIALPTVYQAGREDPIRFGVVRVGRAVRFRRTAIDRIVAGDT